MTGPRIPRLERILERTVRAVAGNALHPLEILKRVEEEARAAVRDGMAPNLVEVSFHPADYQTYEPAFADLRAEIGNVLLTMERREGLRRLGSRMVAFNESAAVAPGSLTVTARFGDTAHRPATASRSRTQRIMRHTGLLLVFSDGTRVPLTHTPFTIGRGAGNDLVLLSRAVSRDHAVIVPAAQGFVIEDKGSRNGLLVEGQRVQNAQLEPGREVLLGDLTLKLEMAPS